LFPYIGYNIRSHKDALILITKLYHSLLYLNIQTSTLSILDQLNRIAYDTLKNVKPTPFTKLNKINVDSADDIIRLIENYKTKFLKEPHEKSD